MVPFELEVGESLTWNVGSEASWDIAMEIVRGM